MQTSIYDFLNKELNSKRIFYKDEKDLQNYIENLLIQNDTIYRREYKLSKKDIIDFYFEKEKLGIEIKIHSKALGTLRQLYRYKNSDQIDNIILILPKLKFVPPTFVKVIEFWKTNF